MKLINLIPLQEIDFPSQAAFDTYSKAHKLRPDTKVVVAGRVTTAGRASQSKGTSVFPTTKNKPAQSFNTKVSKMTDDNDHSSAAVELAIYMDDKDAVSKLQKIKRQHDKDGSITPESAKKRDKMVDDLLKKAKETLTNKDYTLVSDSF
jgi:hypothetical protein